MKNSTRHKLEATVSQVPQITGSFAVRGSVASQVSQVVYLWAKQISISTSEYAELKQKATEYDALAAKVALLETENQKLRTGSRQDSSKIEIKTISQKDDSLNNLESPSKEEIQARRDEVRAMVAAGKPLNGIPLYHGRPKDGDSVAFLQKYYAKYLSADNDHVLFASDLKKIDGRLLRAIRFDYPGEDFPIGTKSDLIDALAVGRFTDWANTTKRVKDALHRRERIGTAKA